MESRGTDNDKRKNLKVQELEAVILDLDGVITQTARTHREAWKEMYRRYSGYSGKDYPMTDEDYSLYIDGKPRYDGVGSFLESRNIELPYGNPGNSAGDKTICGLGNLKNEIFLDLLDKNGVEIYPDSINQIKKWRSGGLKCGVVSSSKNCLRIIEKAGISDLFDTRVDGLTLTEYGLRGKPAPDMFLEAARRLGTKPLNCAIFEDAISGVQAGSRGNFPLVVGVNRKKDKKVLYENGADIVIENLEEIDLFSPDIRLFFVSFAPSLFLKLSEFNTFIKNKKPVLFLDYDGTLTPIVKRPEDAILSDGMRNILGNYCSKSSAAIVSGRDMDDVRKLVGLENIIYSGSHGFRISGPGGLYMEHEKSTEIVPALDRIEEELHELYDGKIKGVQIDRKRYAIAVHYRNVAKEDVEEVIRKAELIIDQNPGFRKGEGKMIVEIRPDIEWHKGKAIGWIMEKLGFSEDPDAVPVYIGDDITDEDVFETLPDRGIGILVGFHGRPTKARYALKNVYQVQLFIEMLTNNIEGRNE